MKLNPTDGYVLNPYIIWGELDFRGSVSLGVQPQDDFKSLSFAKELNTNWQYIRRFNKDFLFISFPLNDFCPKRSPFNLTDRQLKGYYFETFEKSQDAIFRTFFRIKHLSGLPVTPLDEKNLFQIWQHYFNPLEENLTEKNFEARNSILENCLPSYLVRERLTGFELKGCHHHFIQVTRFNDLNQIVQQLKDFSICINGQESTSEILIHIHGKNTDSIISQSQVVKSKLHSLPGTDYFEANSKGENVRLFESAVPGWIPVTAKTEEVQS